jgi:hypothetical protein
LDFAVGDEAAGRGARSLPAGFEAAVAQVPAGGEAAYAAVAAGVWCALSGL